MKNLVLSLAIFSIILQAALGAKSNSIRMFNFNYVSPSTQQTVKYAMKYNGMALEFETNEDVAQTQFKFVWTYANADESSAGHQVYEKVSSDLSGAKENSDSFAIEFSGNQVQNLKFYKKTEFGSAYTLEVKQGEVTVQFQLQIKAHEVNDDEFHEIIAKLTGKTFESSGFLQFLDN